MKRVDMMPEELKELLNSLPLEELTEDMTGFSLRGAKFVKFTVSTIPDPELGNSTISISSWLIKHIKLKPGITVWLTTDLLSTE